MTDHTNFHDLVKENTTLRDDISSLRLAIDSALDCLDDEDVDEARRVLERSRQRMNQETGSSG